MKTQLEKEDHLSEDLRRILNDLKDSYNSNISTAASDEELNSYHYNENYDGYDLYTK